MTWGRKFEFAIAKDGICDRHIVYESVDHWPIWTAVEDEGLPDSTSAMDAAEIVRTNLAYVTASAESQTIDPDELTIDAATTRFNILISEWAQEFEWDEVGAFVSAVSTLLIEQEALPSQ